MYVYLELSVFSRILRTKIITMSVLYLISLSVIIGYYMYWNGYKIELNTRKEEDGEDLFDYIMMLHKNKPKQPVYKVPNEIKNALLQKDSYKNKKIL